MYTTNGPAGTQEQCLLGRPGKEVASFQTVRKTNNNDQKKKSAFQLWPWQKPPPEL